MTKIMNKIYYMLVEQIGQENAQRQEVKALMHRKCAVLDAIALRIGEDGSNMLDELANLDAELGTIHDKTLFRAAVSLGAELAQPWQEDAERTA